MGSWLCLENVNSDCDEVTTFLMANYYVEPKRPIAVLVTDFAKPCHSPVAYRFTRNRISTPRFV